jgi:hypothetical protein
MRLSRPFHWRRHSPANRGDLLAEAQTEWLLTRRAERRQQEAKVRLMNLEVARRALMLAGAAVAVGIVLTRLATGVEPGGIDVALSGLALALGLLQRS